jgi:hypothetical protein
LWRINNEAESTHIDQVRLAEGIHLHVVHSPLTTVAMRIGERTRFYLVLEGCAGCLRDQCRVGCPAALFRRLFQSCVAGAAVHAVAPPQGLAERPYIRGAFAWPDTDSQPLQSALLHTWADARLLLHWRRYGARMCGSALLLTTADGPEPVSALRERGWRAFALPTCVVARWRQAATPPALPFGAPWRQPLFLLLPPGADPAPPLQRDQSIVNATVDAPSPRKG